VNKAILQRKDQSKQGTFGTLTIIRKDGESLTIQSLERNWHDNKRNISCIPAGVYDCSLYNSATKGRRYLVKRVPGRGGILIHAGNYAGDPPLKFNSNGCILVGLGLGWDPVTKQEMVLSSRKALALFESFLNGEPFQLEVKDI